MNAKIESGRGVKIIFFPNRDLGTGDGVQLGTGRYR